MLIFVVAVMFYKQMMSTKPQPKVTPASPYPTPTTAWQNYTNSRLGISFQYPKSGSLMENKEKLVDSTMVDVGQSIFVTVPVQCNFENSGYFVIEVSDTPPIQELLNYLTAPQTIGGKQGKGCTYVPANLQSDGRDSEMVLVKYQNKYYLIKDETCSSDVGKQMLKSIRFL